VNVTHRRRIYNPQFIDVEDKKKKVVKMANPAFTKFYGEMEALYSQEKDIEHEEFFIRTLRMLNRIKFSSVLP
jgi:hypothetical protein